MAQGYYYDAVRDGSYVREDPDFGETLVSKATDLARQQAKAVDAKLREMLAARGVDPDDRSDGWEDRARAVLGDLEFVDSFDMSDPARMTATTVIRPRSADRQ